MKHNKILITENQLKKLKFFIIENEVYRNSVKKIVQDLVKNYEPVVDAESNGVEFFDSLKINKKIDNTLISPNELLNYFKYSYPNYNPEFLKTVINDWFFGKIDDDFNLSKNVSIFNI